MQGSSNKTGNKINFLLIILVKVLLSSILPAPMQHNLEESVAKYLESDVIQHMCPRCGFEYANLTKNIQLSSVLIIQFLRFTFCPQESKTLKIGDKIDTPYIYSPDSTTRYHLSAFICHQGEEATSGHYICGVVSDNSVTICDDDKEPRVMSLDEAQSLVSSSYIVVYTRKLSLTWI